MPTSSTRPQRMRCQRARLSPRCSASSAVITRPDQRRQQDRLGNRRGDVGNAHLDRREIGRRTDIPIDHPVVQHRAGVLQHSHNGVVLVGGLEMRRRSALGQRCHRMLRQLAYPVSVLRYTAEFAVSASSSGSHGRSRLLTWIAASRSGTATCTWQPQMPCSWAIMPNRSAIRR